MNMVSFEKCCFCVPLKYGCFIIAYLNLIGSILGIIYTICIIMAGTEYQISLMVNERRESDFTFPYFGSVLIIYFFLSFVFAIVLLIGLQKKQPAHVKVYLIYYLVSLIVFALVYVLFVGLVTGLSGKVIEVKILSKYWLMNIYFLLVINIYHQRMLEEKSVNVQDY